MRPRHDLEWASGRHGLENMVCDKKSGLLRAGP
jgi:hypothetical protein